MRSEGGADIGQERHVTGALDGAGDHPLFHGAGARALARQDLAVAADHLAQRFGVLVVDVDLAALGSAGDLHLGTAEALELLFSLTIGFTSHWHCRYDLKVLGRGLYG